MMRSPFPENYEQWHHCITVDCGIDITPDFVSQRLAVWRNADNQETQRFADLYGDDYLQAVIGWFEKAAAELGMSA